MFSKSRPQWVVVSEKNGMHKRPAQHPTEESAFAEAERLAKLNQNDVFFVLEVKGYKTVQCVFTRIFSKDLA